MLLASACKCQYLAKKVFSFQLEGKLEITKGLGPSAETKAPNLNFTNVLNGVLLIGVVPILIGHHSLKMSRNLITFEASNI